MTNKKSINFRFRVIHRYLGFFLAGIMAVYAFSGIVLIFRDTDFLKKEKNITKQIKPNAEGDEIGQMLGIRGFTIEKEEGDIIYFRDGSYNKSTGDAEYVVKQLPTVIDKMTQIHKARSAEPLFFLNIFFGVSLLFFVISAFWMFTPKTSIFKKGLMFALGGIILTLILLFV